MIDAINQSLQDICGNDIRKGSLVVLYGGDFRQTVHVVVESLQANY